VPRKLARIVSAASNEVRDVRHSNPSIDSTDSAADAPRLTPCRAQPVQERQELEICGEELKLCRDDLELCRDELERCRGELALGLAHLTCCREKRAAVRRGPFRYQQGSRFVDETSGRSDAERPHSTMKPADRQQSGPFALPHHNGMPSERTQCTLETSRRDAERSLRAAALSCLACELSVRAERGQRNSLMTSPCMSPRLTCRRAEPTRSLSRSTLLVPERSRRAADASLLSHRSHRT
jgi:hypothetical protein